MRYHIICYVPQGYVDSVKRAMFDAGAGRFEGYRDCCWQTSGNGQFVPEESASPFIGSMGNVETVEEIKLEMFCQSDCIEGVIAALNSAHPYEVPAYGVYETVF